MGHGQSRLASSCRVESVVSSPVWARFVEPRSGHVKSCRSCHALSGPAPSRPATSELSFLEAVLSGLSEIVSRRAGRVQSCRGMPCRAKSCRDGHVVEGRSR